MAVDMLRTLLPPGVAALMGERWEEIKQIRLRAGRPVQLVYCDGSEALSGEALDRAGLSRLLTALMEYSVYARQDDLDAGFFTLDDGCRVGVCGRMIREGTRLRMEEIGSACIRLARQHPGCADPIMDLVDGPEGLSSTLLVSPPGMGKTSLLRDISRQLSGRGYDVSVADERHELAACHQGIPTLDIGLRCDVMDGCPRSSAIGRLVRTMAPEVIVVDEIGDEQDALALADAARCGVAVIASAHGYDLEDLLARPCLRSVLEGVVKGVVLLGPRPGAVRRRWRSCVEGGITDWKCD